MTKAQARKIALETAAKQVDEQSRLWWTDEIAEGCTSARLAEIEKIRSAGAEVAIRLLTAAAKIEVHR